MKQYPRLFSIFTLAYVAVSFFATPLLRVRYLLIFLVLACIAYLSEWVTAAYFLGSGAIIALFFFKLIPSPYPYFSKMGLPMGISILATVAIIGAVVLAWIVLVKSATLIANKRTTKGS